MYTNKYMCMFVYVYMGASDPQFFRLCRLAI